MDQVMQFVEPSRQFVKDSIRLVKRCTKPDRKVTPFEVNQQEISFIVRLAGVLLAAAHHAPLHGSHLKIIGPTKFQKIAMATAIGFAIMGFIGFFVKLIHIPINNIIVGG
uniref:SEC61 translocon subunit gamma n=1 Tax=Cairina moschata TaxID=8855 RepID=A0A8C3B7D3_CAIMO